jgi:hypothetical protein
MQKPTKATINARIEEVLRIRLDGAEFWDVREYVREKHRQTGSVWEAKTCLSDAQLYRYLAKADLLIAQSCRSSRKRLLRRHLAQRRNLYAKAVNAGDLRTALSVLHDEASLLHLYEVFAPPIPKDAATPTPNVQDVLARQLAQVDAADLPAAEKARTVAALAEALLRVTHAQDVDRQIADLSARMKRLAANEGPGS